MNNLSRLLIVTLFSMLGAWPLCNGHAWPLGPVHVDPKVTAAREALASNPALQEAWALNQALHEEWFVRAWCTLMQPGQPPMVRLRAAELLERPMNEVPMPCTTDFELRTGGEVRRQVLDQSWDDPKALMWIYWQACRGGRPETWCDRNHLQARMIELEPDNAAPVLLSFAMHQFESQAQSPVVKDPDTWLTKAAERKYFDLHEHAGAHDAFQAVRRYAEDHPLPEVSPALLDALENAQYQMGIGEPDTLAVHFLYSRFIITTWRPLDLYCIEDANASNDSVKNDCLSVARLMAQSPSSTVSEQGVALARNLEPQTEIIEDGKSNRDVEGRLRMLAFNCAQPRVSMDGLFQIYEQEMPSAWWVEQVAYYEDHGERAAQIKALNDEYGLYPEVYPFDPVHCSRIPLLEPEMKLAVYELARDENDQAALEALAPWFEPLRHVGKGQNPQAR